MFHLLCAELRRTFYHRSALYFAAITILAALLLMSFNLNTLFDPDRAKALAAFAVNLAFPNSLLTAVFFGGAIFYLLMPALAAQISGADYQADTWKMILPRAPSRSRLFLMRIIVIVIHALALWALVFAVVHLVTLAGGWFLGAPLLAAPKTTIWTRDTPHLAADLVFNFWLITVAAALTIVTRSTLTGIVGTFALVAFANLFLSYAPPSASFYLLQAHLNNLTPGNWQSSIELAGQITVDDAARPPNTPVWLSWIIVICHLTANLVIAWAVFLKQDFDGKKG